MESDDEAITEEEKERSKRTKKLAAELNAAQSEERERDLEAEAYELLEPSIREHARVLRDSKVAAARKFVK